MPDYEKLYFQLFNDVSRVIKWLKEIQEDSEDRFVEHNVPEPPLPPESDM